MSTTPAPAPAPSKAGAARRARFGGGLDLPSSNPPAANGNGNGNAPPTNHSTPRSNKGRQRAVASPGSSSAHAALTARFPTIALKPPQALVPSPGRGAADAQEEHFKTVHFLCPHPTCLEQKFVVFETELDLQAHAVATHGAALSGDQRSRRDARRGREASS
ncbi:hypothetical protein P7C70_g8328, partial [Phenoliferia sp. Uapishka_3]